GERAALLRAARAVTAPCVPAPGPHDRAWHADAPFQATPAEPSALRRVRMDAVLPQDLPMGSAMGRTARGSRYRAAHSVAADRSDCCRADCTGITARAGRLVLARVATAAARAQHARIPRGGERCRAACHDQGAAW